MSLNMYTGDLRGMDLEAGSRRPDNLLVKYLRCEGNHVFAQQFTRRPPPKLQEFKIRHHFEQCPSCLENGECGYCRMPFIHGAKKCGFCIVFCALEGPGLWMEDGEGFEEEKVEKQVDDEKMDWSSGCELDSLCEFRIGGLIFPSTKSWKTLEAEYEEMSQLMDEMEFLSGGLPYEKLGELVATKPTGRGTVADEREMGNMTETEEERIPLLEGPYHPALCFAQGPESHEFFILPTSQVYRF